MNNNKVYFIPCFANELCIMLRFCLCICFETIWVYTPFLTNLEDEISVKGGRICKAQNVYKKIYNNKINI
jgi:hypothetical protein